MSTYIKVTKTEFSVRMQNTHSIEKETRFTFATIPFQRVN